MLKSIALLLIVFAGFIFIPLSKAYAATSPDLGQAASFAILSSTYTNTVLGTTINGDLGYTTGPAVAPIVSGTIFSPPAAKYSAAGTDQGSALSILNAQPCDFNFDSATDLSLLEQPLGPGVYCVIGATSIGTGGVTLSGAGTYIFRSTGALNTVANSVITLAGGASACNVFWTPTATTLGANSTFIGTDIDDSGITIGSTVNWTGRALAFGGTISTDTDTITSSTCTAATTPTPTPTSGSSSNSTSTSGVEIKYCPPINSQIVTPIIIESKRVSVDSIFISWGPFSGVDTFNVEYGFENGKWLYNANVTGFSTTIRALPANQPIWVRVAARNECQIGNYGDSRLVGGPRLPSTGFAPQSENIFYVLGQIKNWLLGL